MMSTNGQQGTYGMQRIFRLQVTISNIYINSILQYDLFASLSHSIETLTTHFICPFYDE